MADAQSVTIPVVVDLAEESTRFAGIAQKISTQLAAVLDLLGLPGSPDVQVRKLDNAQSQDLRVSVNSRQCPYSSDLLKRIFDYTQGAEFAALAAVEIVKLRPDLLVSPEQAHAYSAAYPEMHAALSATVGLRISVADRVAVANLIGNAIAEGRTPDDLAEDLIDALSTSMIEIQLCPQDLSRLITSPGRPRQLLAVLRQDLFNELGLHYPAFVFAPETDLKANSFRFKINHLTLAPRTGLEAGGLEYMISDCLRAELRQNSACFISRTFVANRCEQFSRRCPALVAAVRSQFSLERVTRCFRALAQDGMSIRDLRTIFQRLVDVDRSVEDTAAFVKAGLRRELRSHASSL